jgi:hypothetical protein
VVHKSGLFYLECQCQNRVKIRFGDPWHLVRIRIPGFVPLTSGSGSGFNSWSDSFLQVWVFYFGFIIYTVFTWINGHICLLLYRMDAVSYMSLFRTVICRMYSLSFREHRGVQNPLVSDQGETVPFAVTFRSAGCFLWVGCSTMFMYWRLLTCDELLRLWPLVYVILCCSCSFVPYVYLFDLTLYECSFLKKP